MNRTPPFLGEKEGKLMDKTIAPQEAFNIGHKNIGNKLNQSKCRHSSLFLIDKLGRPFVLSEVISTPGIYLGICFKCGKNFSTKININSLQLEL